MTFRDRLLPWVTALASCLVLVAGARAEGRSAADAIHEYREMLEDANPADLVEMRGEELWSTARGPRHASLEQCDLGLGPGVLDGAYARLPRYFADTGRVQDAESRLVTCITRLQGIPREDVVRHWYRRGSDIEALVTFVAARSKGSPVDVPAREPHEAALLAVGADFFFRRSGPLDFACSTCHSQDDRRIRLQEVPNFTDPAAARASMTQWPAYRVSQSSVWTMERRLVDCIRQMRYPEPGFASDVLVALQLYLQHQASGGVMQGPGIRR